MNTPKKAINFKIEGGVELSGEITTNTAKNSAVSLLCASLLNKGKTTLVKMPKIEEVNRILEVLKSIGVSAVWHGSSITLERPETFDFASLDIEAAMRTRSIIMLMGPLIHEFKHFKLPQAGGCRLGSRTVRPHFFALEKLGVKVKTTKDSYEISSKIKDKDNTIILYESGDTVTENALMSASRVNGTTTIKFASANYMVQDMCRFLETLGVSIEGIGTTTLIVRGKKDIQTDVKFTPGEDPIESMLFLSIAATTNSSITIKACPIDFLELELLKLEKMGFKYKILKEYVSENGYTRLVDIKTMPSRLRALKEKIEARPFPGLNIDNLPFFVPIATRAEGQTLIHDWAYENRAIYYLELAKLGADIILADPHRVYINGGTKLKPAEVVCPPALRPAAIILIGMLAAKGTSILRNVYSINRGYEDLASRLRKLGANIRII